MEVYIDSREQETGQRMLTYWERNKLRFKHIENVSIRTNKAGDVCTDDGYIGFERKKEDFVPSIFGGKLKKQLFELKQNFTHAFLFVEGYDGIMDCIEKNLSVHPEVIHGAIDSAFAHCRVPVTFVGPFYIPRVFGIIEKFYDGKEMTSETYNPIRRACTREEEQLNILIGINGIGFVEGKKLLQTFNNSIASIISAPIEELMKVERIGRTKAKHIKEVLA